MKILALLGLFIVVSACSYRHYLGMHGPSIKRYPAAHDSVTSDQSCLICHAGNATRKTSHPNFTGCLKCHNDDLSHTSLDRRDRTMGSVPF